MFDEGNLLYFDTFKFEDGTSKPKFFIVLKNIDGLSVLASLPTSKDHIPSDVDVHAGCYELPERCVNVYVFMADVVIAVNIDNGRDFSFNKNTFIYGADLNMYPVGAFLQQSLKGETTIKVIGKLKPDVFADLKCCLKNSVHVKNKYRKLL